MQLTPEQVSQFAEDGYLLLRGALTDADLDPIIAEYEEYIGRRAEELLAAGHISALYADEPFDRRLVSICREDDAIYRELDIMHLRGRASFEFLRNDRLLDMVESLVGPEVTCSPIQHTRAKLPRGCDAKRQRLARGPLAPRRRRYLGGGRPALHPHGVVAAVRGDAGKTVVCRSCRARIGTDWCSTTSSRGWAR